MNQILVIKLGALGDFVMGCAAFSAIREHHRKDHITLLTIPSLVELGRACGYFDAVREDRRGRWPLGHWHIARDIRRARYARVYDLQGTRRTAWYWRFTWPHRPAWAGPVVGCSLPRPPRPVGGHRVEWYRAQLTALGLTVADGASFDWLHGDIAGLAHPSRYALLVAGGSAHRPEKRWPAGHYVALAQALIAQQITPLLIGTAVDAGPNESITQAVPGSRDLTGRTSIAQLASLARGAICAIGNDTGPMHVIAAAGAPSVVLFSRVSDPVFIGPRGPLVRCLQAPVLAALSASAVHEVVLELIRHSTR